MSSRLGHTITNTIRLTKTHFDICNYKNSVHIPFPDGESLKKKKNKVEKGGCLHEIKGISIKNSSVLLTKKS